MNRFIWHFAAIVTAGLLAWGCSDSSDEKSSSPPTGTLHAALAFAGTTHDVAAMELRVVSALDDCIDGAVLDSAIAVIEDEALPVWVSAAGTNHAFSDALFVLQPGDYRVCVTPLQEDGTPSAVCGPAEDVFTVVAEQTTEGVIYSQCEGDPSGGLDVIAALNNPPHIDNLDILESKFITTCERALITVEASDPDGDELTYTWEVTDAPAGSSPVLIGTGDQAVFSADVEGPYGLLVTVDDGLGGTTQLSFPVHVSFEDCEPTCDERCEALAESVVQACLDVIEQFLPQGGEAFCAQAGLWVSESCNIRICEQQLDCRDACAAIAGDALDQCLPVSPDPVLCEGGAQLIEQDCLDEFQCPPLPLPCDQQCFADAEALLDRCLADPIDLICLDSPNPAQQTCVVQAQGALNACVFGPGGCFPELSCQQVCEADFAQGLVDCSGEPNCGDPGSCSLQGGQGQEVCQQQCCLDECTAELCAPQCEGDPACLEECVRNGCQPQCSPEPSCDQACANAANNVIADCLDDRPPEPICPDSDNDCVALGFDAFAQCIEGQCALDGCGVRCVQSCIEGCEDVEACQQDPALTGECQAECNPPPPVCEDDCGREFEACLASGADPLECEERFELCLDDCAPPAVCEDGCFGEFDQCLGEGNDPELCEARLQVCFDGCNPIRLCEDICADEIQVCVDAGVDPRECEAGFDECLAGCGP